MLSTRPLAIGLLFWVGYPTPVERLERVKELQRQARRDGLVVIKTFESNGPDDEEVRAAVLDLVARVDVAALVVAGPGWPLLRSIAEHTRLPWHVVAEETPMRQVMDRQGWVRLVPQGAVAPGFVGHGAR